jgi:urease accessory protein
MSFVSVMMLGGVIGLAGVAVPFVELGIGLSIVVLGGAVAFGFKAHAAAMTLVGFFAVFHGYAHGAEMPETASGLAYGAGFVLATATLHAAGLGLGLLLDSKGKARGSLFVRSLGAWPPSPVLVSWPASFEAIAHEPLNDDDRQRGPA